MFTDEKIAEIAEILKVTPGDIFLGCDSVKYKKGGKWWARYATVLVLHINNLHGCRVFGFIDRERDYDSKEDKPRLRLMNEVYRVADCYIKLGDLLEDREVQIHLDINPDTKYQSSAVIQQAVGYILGMTGIQPMVKPEAFAASYAADTGARKEWYT